MSGKNLIKQKTKIKGYERLKLKDTRDLNNRKRETKIKRYERLK